MDDTQKCIHLSYCLDQGFNQRLEGLVSCEFAELVLSYLQALFHVFYRRKAALSICQQNRILRTLSVTERELLHPET
jgi:hypothetical protein